MQIIGLHYSAQRIIERREARQRFVKELRSINVVNSLAFHIANVYFNIKKQHVKGLYESYHAAKQRLHEVAKTSGPKPAYTFKADLGYLESPVVPIDQVQSIVAAEISARGRPLVLPSMMAQAIRSLTHALLLRNDMINAFKAQNLTPEDFPFVYFGLKTERGVDGRYGQTIDAIQKYTDDCIHFSVLLIRDLEKHAVELRRQYKERFKEAAPTTTTADFSRAEKDGLMPPASEYTDWESAFQPAAAPTPAAPRRWKFWKR